LGFLFSIVFLCLLTVSHIPEGGKVESKNLTLKQMEFKDFQHNYEELIGKTVLYESGQSYSERRSWSLVKITKVTKTGFRLFSMPDYLFGFIDGKQKGLTDKIYMGTVSKCRLVTDEEANELRERWKRDKEVRILREKILEKVKTMSFEQLKKMDLL